LSLEKFRLYPVECAFQIAFEKNQKHSSKQWYALVNNQERELSPSKDRKLKQLLQSEAVARVAAKRKKCSMCEPTKMPWKVF
jgi:hypothetical protein